MVTLDLNEYFDEEVQDENEFDGENNVVEENPLQTNEHNNNQQALVVFNGANESEAIVDPAVGMEFDSGEEFGDFCYSYAYKKGFQFRVRTSDLQDVFKAKGVSRKGTGDNERQFYMMKRIRLICTKGRKSNPEPNWSRCLVCVEEHIPDKKSKFVISQVHLKHNHDVDPSSSRHVVHYRHITAYFKKRMILNDKAGIPITRNFNTIAMECGGVEEVPFNERDIRNAINKERQKSRLKGDAQELFNYFEKLKKDNPDFYYAMKTDDDGMLVNVFWADARCRAMYKVFGDVVSYDTTFLSNRYQMPFCPFVGVNHHGSTIIFTAGLMTKEDTDSFVWMFEKWLDCMGSAPAVMITDQCKAMEGAIRRVFPQTKHRLCLWHILQNADKNLRSHAQFTSIDRALLTLVQESYKVEEFEKSWIDMVVKYKLEQHNWIRESYSIRRQWAPVYWRDTFCAGMSSTQRSEQTNRYLKSFVGIETGLRQFIEQFEFALQRKVAIENNLNHEDNHRPAKWDARVFFEDLFQKVYTNKKFAKVKDQVFFSFMSNVDSLTSAFDFIKRYNVTSRELEPHWSEELRSFEVSIDLRNDIYKCDCKLFEFSGILCGHIMKCLDVLNVRSIPQKYILDRWRKDLVRGYESIRVGYYDPEESERHKRKMIVIARQDYITNLALHNEEAFHLYMESIKTTAEVLENHVGVQPKETFRDDEKSTLVYGRKRVQRKKANDKNPNQDGHIKDPPNKRRRGRRNIPKQPKRRKTVTTQVNIKNPSPARTDSSSQFSGFSSSQLRDSQLTPPVICS